MAKSANHLSLQSYVTMHNICGSFQLSLESQFRFAVYLAIADFCRVVRKLAVTVLKMHFGFKFVIIDILNVANKTKVVQVIMRS